MIIPRWYAIQADDSARGRHFRIGEATVEPGMKGVTKGDLRGYFGSQHRLRRGSIYPESISWLSSIQAACIRCDVECSDIALASISGSKMTNLETTITQAVHHVECL